MPNSDKTQEFVTKLETICDLFYLRGDERKTLDNVSKSDLLAIEELMQRCHTIIKKSMIERVV